MVDCAGPGPLFAARIFPARPASFALRYRVDYPESSFMRPALARRAISIPMHQLLSDPHRRHLVLTLLSGAGLAAYLTGSVVSVLGFDLAMLVALVGGLPIYLESARALTERKISADLAVTLAALAALTIREYAVAAEVILIMLVGESLEHFAVGRTRSGIAALLALRPHDARVRRGDQEQVTHADEVRHDDLVLVRPGDRIPIDGRVLRGSSSVDQSPITGESLPVDKTTGDEVFAGTINLYGSLELVVERLGHDTTLEQIIHLVEEAEEAKAPTQRLADRYATFFVPVVILAAALTWLITRDVVRSVAVLVVACPCALVLATPTAVAAGIGALVRRGVLLKGGAVLESLGRLRSVVFDKTGTLTLAKLQIESVVAAPGWDETEVLRLAAAVERDSEHPIGRLLVERARNDGSELAAVEDFVASPGLGAEATVSGLPVRVGSPRYIEQRGARLPEPLAARLVELGRQGCTVVLVARCDEVVGAVAVRDAIRPEASEAVRRLRAMGINRIAMLTGDHEAAARSVAATLGIDEVRNGLLPQDKVDEVRRLQREAAPVAMVGDGINDAPSLAAAEVGVAMAEIGTDVAISSAGVVLIGDDLRKLADAVAFGRRTLRIIWQNIIAFALVVNVLAVLAASFGWISPVAAAVLHQVSSLTVVLNSLRLLVDTEHLRTRARHAWTRVLQRRGRLALAGALAAGAIYVASGVHVVGIGEVGVVQRFGKFVGPVEPPGLHYRLPAPFGWHWIVRPNEIRRVEIGFRNAPGTSAEPPAYEWNVQHRGGRYERQAEEGAVWAGDENLVDANLVVHYRVRTPEAALFQIGARLDDGADKWDALIRSVAEASLRAATSRQSADALLHADRGSIAAAVRSRIQQELQRYAEAFSVDEVCLGDIHPPVEVVPAFRDVASAAEEKESSINEAQAYRYKTETLARGKAAQQVLSAEGLEEDRVRKAEGAADRFAQVAAASAETPQVTRLRLYLQTVEEVLANRRKIILDAIPAGTRRLLYLGQKRVWMPPRPPSEIPETTEPRGAIEK